MRELIRELWDLIWIGHAAGTSGVIQFGMFYLAILYMMANSKKFKYAKTFVWYTLLFYVVFVFPVTAFVLMNYAMESFIYWRMIWALPVLIVIGYALVEWKYLFERKMHQMLFVLALAGVLLLNPGWVNQLTTRAENIYHLPNIVINTIDTINDIRESKSPRVVFPVDMHPYVRQYDASYMLLFNWNASFKDSMTENLPRNRSLIFEMIDTNEYDWGILKELLRQEEVNYFVVNRFEHGSVVLYPEFEVVGETDWLYIFQYTGLSRFNTFFNGIDYSPVYNYHFFTNRYGDSIPELRGATEDEALEYFVTVGMANGLQGSSEFNLEYFKSNYPELKVLFGDDYSLFYYHYMGYRAGRLIIYEEDIEECLAGFMHFSHIQDCFYRLVFNYLWFINQNREDPLISEMNEQEALEFFITIGMELGMQGSPDFDINVYKEYEDLAEYFGDNLRGYYYHFIELGYDEGRVAVEENEKDEKKWEEGDLIAFMLLPVFQGQDYSHVFNFEWFMNQYRDNPLISEMAEQEALEFFVTTGMELGMQGSPFFDIDAYKENNEGLISVFGDDLRAYYFHFIHFGFYERRIAVNEEMRSAIRLIR